jgi:ketosteroid isomerase-like protein
MKRLDIGSLALFAVFLLLNGSPADAAPPESQLERSAEQALAARQKMMQLDAGPAEVDAFLAFFTDDVIYEDPVVNMKLEGKDTIRKGMTGFLGATRNARITVTGRLSAANVVVLGQTVSFDSRDEGQPWKPQTRHQLTVFEFDGTRIRRIADYWSR